MKGFVIAIVLLAIGLVAADRVSLLVAERAVAARLAETGVSTASVDIRGVPFLTQAVRGRYDEVFVEATDVPAGDNVTLSMLDATLQGVHIPLQEALSREVNAVPVEGVRATVVLPYSELARRSGATGVTVEQMGDRIEITGTVDVLGRTLAASTVSTVELVEDEIIVTAESFDVGSGVVNMVLTKALRGVFDFRIPLSELPYDMVPSGFDITDRGIVLQAFASDTVLTALPR